MAIDYSFRFIFTRQDKKSWKLETKLPVINLLNKASIAASRMKATQNEKKNTIPKRYVSGFHFLSYLSKKKCYLQEKSVFDAHREDECY